MKDFIAVMKWDGGNRVTKFQDFGVKDDADAHVGTHADNFPNAFVVSKPNDSFGSWLVDPITKTVSIDFPVIVPPTLTERVAKIAESTSDADVLQFKMMFRFKNSILRLEGKPTLTKAQFLTFLESELP